MRDFAELEGTAAERLGPDGQSSVDSDTEVCGAVTVHLGLFFDGTFNNEANMAAGVDARASGEETGGSYDQKYTNVVHRMRLYYGDPEEIRHDCGSLQIAYRSYYVPGIATLDEQNDDLFSGATGLGSRGVHSRASAGLTRAREILDELGAEGRIEHVHVDVFGFSRGAAAARLFANMVANGELPPVA